MARLIKTIALGNKSQPHSPRVTTSMSDRVHPADSMVTKKPRPSYSKFLRRVLRRSQGRLEDQNKGITKRQDFVTTDSTVVDPEHVQMDITRHQGPCGSPGSSGATSVGTLSYGEASTPSTNSFNVEQPERIWRSANWSDVQIT